MFACMHAPGLADSSCALLVNCACGFSPRVEETDTKTVVLDIDGLDRLLGPPERIANAMARRASELGIQVHVAIASNPDAAIHGARGFPGITVIPPGEESKILGSLPVEILSPLPDIEETLQLWGIRFCRELAALPVTGVSERLGPEGIQLQKLARGAGDRPLAPAIPATGFEESLELEYPVALLEPLSFLLARLLHELLARLEGRGLAADELRLRLKLEDQTEHARTLRLPFPMRNDKVCLKLLQLDLELHPPQSPVVAIALGATAADPRVIQYGLFLPPAPEAEKLELILGRIAKLVGAGNVGTAELVDTHRPGAFRMKPFTVAQRRTSQESGRLLKTPSRRLLADARGAVSALESSGVFPSRDRGGAVSGVFQRSAGGRHSCPQLILRVYRPPLRAKVEAPSGRPSRIVARGLHGTVVSLAGPWRSSGEWWDPTAWSRDEWDVALHNGSLCRIYKDRHKEEWFVEGIYD